MARGRGQGWEEKVQHKVFAQYLQNKGFKKNKTFFNEVRLNIENFGNNAKESRIDFVVVHRRHIEIVECKQANHPSYDLMHAIGGLLIYRSLIELGCEPKNIPRDILDGKDIHLSICMVNGYKYGKSGDEWTNAHNELLKKMEKILHKKIGIYLIEPISEKKATKTYWEKPECQIIRKLGN